MLLATALGIFFVPVLFVTVGRLTERRGSAVPAPAAAAKEQS
jgi:hypothetical protein